MRRNVHLTRHSDLPACARARARTRTGSGAYNLTGSSRRLLRPRCALGPYAIPRARHPPVRTTVSPGHHYVPFLHVLLWRNKLESAEAKGGKKGETINLKQWT